MKQSAVQEIRNQKGKLFAKYYPDKGVIEIAIKGCRVQLIIPPETQIHINPGDVLTKK